jgi:hypothetical protein
MADGVGFLFISGGLMGLNPIFEANSVMLNEYLSDIPGRIAGRFPDSIYSIVPRQIMESFIACGIWGRGDLYDRNPGA